MISTITADQSKALVKAGLGHVCIFNGELRNSKDFSELPANELARAQAIVTGSTSKKAEPSTKPAPVHRKKKQ